MKRKVRQILESWKKLIILEMWQSDDEKEILTNYTCPECKAISERNAHSL